ncbi:tRNA (guanine(37)-N1)-methyltransferase Trm5b [uncultured archaeon]|nr:tRNA (guanine(37)-N1)-methyltransferase Trm5b [uncultured archaeon]
MGKNQQDGARTLCLAVEPAHAQSVLSRLRERGWVDERWQVGRDGHAVLVPIREECREQAENARLGELMEAWLPAAKARPGSLREMLQGVLSDEEYEHLLSSFDVMGDIAMLEIPAELAGKQEEIAQAVMRLYPHVKTVVKKEEGTGGPYRIRPVSVMAGEKRTRTVSKENGCSFVVDLNKAYYNPRMATERLRVAEQIGRENAGEHVLVLFAGVGPYAVLAEKAPKAGHKPAKIAAIELNPDAVEMMKENVKLNKCKKIEVVEGDVEKVLGEPRFRAFADRIIMPHPTESMRFLPAALRAARKGAVIHLYAFGPAEEPLPLLLEEAQEIAEKAGAKLALLSWRVLQSYSPTLVQIVMDLQVGQTE